jgi:hypothetical protein
MTTYVYSSSPEYIIFYYIVYLCDEVVSYLILFFKNKNKNSKTSEGPHCHIDKVVKNCICR